MSLVCEDEEMDEISVITDAAIKETSQFIRRTARAYHDNEGYAPTLTGLEKSLTEIKPFAADSDVTIYEFVDKFKAYCSGTKRAKAYKLWSSYLSVSIKAQTESLKHDYNAMISYLQTTYGKIEVVSANLLAELERRKKPGDNDLPERADSLLAIMNVILRVQHLNKLVGRYMDSCNTQL